MGFVDSGTAFVAVVRSTLKSFAPPGDCHLLTYVVDLVAVVQYLGQLISKGERRVTHDRVAEIQKLTKPQTKRQLLSFLGMITYCRQWIADCFLTWITSCGQ